MTGGSDSIQRRGRVRVEALWFDAVTADACADAIMGALARGWGGRLVTVNLDYLAWCARRQPFLRFCRDAQLIVADGMPIVWASRLQGTPLPERVTGADLLWSLSTRAAGDGRSVFLAGGAPGDAARAAASLVRANSALRVAGVDAPAAAGLERVDTTTLFAAIDATNPNIVFVGLPALKAMHVIEAGQQRWPRVWWITVGAGFAFAAGTARRAPRWQQRVGLEWAHRLAREPRRLARRYLLVGVPTAAALLGRAAARRLGGRGGASEPGGS